MPPTSRIAASHLQMGQFQGQDVRAVGKLISVDGEQVQLKLVGDGPNAVICPQDGTAAFPADAVNREYFEVIGKLGADYRIAPMLTVRLGETFDFELYADMVNLSHQFPDIF